MAQAKPLLSGAPFAAVACRRLASCTVSSFFRSSASIFCLSQGQQQDRGAEHLEPGFLQLFCSPEKHSSRSSAAASAAGAIRASSHLLPFNGSCFTPLLAYRPACAGASGSPRRHTVSSFGESRRHISSAGGQESDPSSSPRQSKRRLFRTQSISSDDKKLDTIKGEGVAPLSRKTNCAPSPLGRDEGGVFAAEAKEPGNQRNPALRVCRDFLDAVGMTPLIYLRRASEEARCDIFAKCEFNNPGGSVKDRPAKYILQQAEREGTDMLKVCGALVVEVPFNKVWHPDHFVAFSGRLASVLNACWGNQFDNLANKLSHFETTGPEIWDQMDGRVDGFVSAAGTGGTVSGVSEFLRTQNPDIQICLADIPGSALFRYFTEGALRAEGSSVVENIGQGRITGQLAGFRPNVAYEIPDAESLSWTHSLLEDEGLAVGMSSGVNVAAAVRFGKKLGPGHRIVTVLCDSGVRYAKKQWNVPFLREEGLPYPRLLADQKRELGGIMEAVHAAYAPRDLVAKLEKAHENDISPPGSKL
ncbi:putative O-acetylserine (thiol) lyase 2 [Besnoitia besnoiti]|uniref:Putative O-acetylserine (Thiol) lyase 2 n=1 Tax=Besnoitia besnoiti TaxID=94643 RepID=A0A2A9M4R6_BESBE|nr:putative O-acetylserine (thiol) lyase 2 [Besnoitia besnoiti]PFH31301.1 putative O-acetylserine (thiol) lyase 2 [Besnoitia besnoiti]